MQPQSLRCTEIDETWSAVLRHSVGLHQTYERPWLVLCNEVDTTQILMNGPRAWNILNQKKGYQHSLSLESSPLGIVIGEGCSDYSMAYVKHQIG